MKSPDLGVDCKKRVPGPRNALTRHAGLTLMFLISSAATLLGQPGTITNVSAGNYRAIVSPDSIVSAWGTNFATATTAATNTTLPTTLGGIQLTLKDSGNQTLTPALYMVAPGQINYVLPKTTQLGKGTLSLMSSSGVQFSGPLLVSQVAPALFTTDGSGNGVPAAQVERVTANGVVTFESPVGSTPTSPRPLDIGSNPTDKIYIILYGTGFRLHSLNPVIATIGGVTIPTLYAGAQSQYPGLDQINIGPIPSSLTGRGTVDLAIVVDGIPANTVQLAIK